MQQLFGDLFKVRHRNAFRRQRQQTRTATGDQHQQQILRRQCFDPFQDLSSSLFTGRIRHWMSGFNYGDAIGQQSMAVTRDDQTIEGRSSRPRLFHGQCHRCCSLARADHQRASFWGRRQVCGQDVLRVCSRDSGGKASGQQFTGRFGFHISTVLR